MATASSLISRAMRLIGVLSSGETLAANEASDGLEALNAMLDSWRNERLMTYAIQDEPLTLVASQASYTVGPGGNLNTTRPVKIDYAYVSAANLDYPVEVVDEQQYASIVAKTSTSDWPEYCYYKPSMSTGTIYVWPVPTTAYTLHLLTWTPFTSFVLADTVTLPPGYEEAIAFNLAIAISPEYGITPSPVVIQKASDAKANIKRINSKVPKATTELGAMFGSHKINILIGE